MSSYSEQCQGLRVIKEDMVSEFWTELQERDSFYRKRKVARRMVYSSFRCDVLAMDFANELTIDTTPTFFPDLLKPEIQEKVAFFGKQVVDKFMGHMLRDNAVEPTRFLHRRTVAVDDEKVTATYYLHEIWAPDYAVRLTDTVVIEGPSLITAEAMK